MTYLLTKSSKCDIPHQLVTYSRDSNEYHRKDTGEVFHGVAIKGTTFRYLFNADEDFFTPKTNCKLFRYSSTGTRATGMFPIVSVNEARGLVYFWDSEQEKWETKGLKLDSLCIPK